MERGAAAGTGTDRSHALASPWGWRQSFWTVVSVATGWSDTSAATVSIMVAKSTR